MNREIVAVTLSRSRTTDVFSFPLTDPYVGVHSHMVLIVPALHLLIKPVALSMFVYLLGDVLLAE